MNRERQAFFDRAVGDIIVLLIAATVCIVLLVSILAIAILEFIDSTVDTSKVVSVLSDTINTLIGVMAGFLAGKTSVGQAKRDRTADE